MRHRLPKARGYDRKRDRATDCSRTYPTACCGLRCNLQGDGEPRVLRLHGLRACLQGRGLQHTYDRRGGANRQNGAYRHERGQRVRRVYVRAPANSSWRRRLNGNAKGRVSVISLSGSPVTNLRICCRRAIKQRILKNVGHVTWKFHQDDVSFLLQITMKSISTTALCLNFSLVLII